MFNFNRDERGFTLVELLIVVAILGVLMAIVVPNVGGLLGTGKEQSFNTDRATIQTAVDAYFLTQNPNRYPTSTVGIINFTFLVTNTNLLRDVPKSSNQSSPTAGSYTWAINSVGTVTNTYTTGVYP